MPRLSSGRRRRTAPTVTSPPASTWRNDRFVRGGTCLSGGRRPVFCVFQGYVRCTWETLERCESPCRARNVRLTRRVAYPFLGLSRIYTCIGAFRCNGFGVGFWGWGRARRPNWFRGCQPLASWRPKTSARSLAAPPLPARSSSAQAMWVKETLENRDRNMAAVKSRSHPFRAR